MKKVITIFGAILFASTTLTSCDSGEKNDEDDFQQSVELIPNTTEINGYLGDALQVVDGSYKLDYKAIYGRREGYISIKIKSIGKGDVNDFGLQDNRWGPLYLTVCDASGKPITGFSDMPSESKGDGLLKGMLNNVGEENWIPFIIEKYDGAELPDEAATFFVTSKKIEKSEDSPLSKNESASSTTKSSGDCDEFLKGYENFMEQYIDIMKKMQNNPNDNSVMTDYTTMMTEATEWADKTADCAEDAKFAAKLTEIQMKIANAASDL